MSREEAIRIAGLYLHEEKQVAFPDLDYRRILGSPTEYNTCWYFDFRYHPPTPGTQVLELAPGAPGFIVTKCTQLLEVITWGELYHLNQAPHPFTAGSTSC